jgi:hypothetical protein
MLEFGGNPPREAEQAEPMSDLKTPPGHDELEQALVRYFGPSITSDQVEELRRDVAALVADFPRYRGVVAYLGPGSRFGEGEAWREEHVGFRSLPTTMNLALLRAASARDRFPPPLPYCPEPLVGCWEMTAREDGIAMVEPHPEWKLSADGSFRAPGERASDASWCVHKAQGGGDTLWVFPRDLPGRTSFIIRSVGDSEMALLPVDRSRRPLNFRRM